MSGDPLHHHQPNGQRPTHRPQPIMALAHLPEQEILQICTRSIEARERKDYDLARREDWKLLNILGIKELSDIRTFEAEQISNLTADHILKEVVKVFTLIASDLERSKRHAIAFDFACRAVQLYPTPDSLRVLGHLCDTNRSSKERTLHVGLRICRMGHESFLKRRFRIRQQPDETITARCRSSDETRQLIQATRQYLASAKKECEALAPERTKDRITLVTRCLPYLRCALSQVGLGGTPRQLCEAQELTLSVEPQETGATWQKLAQILFLAYELRSMSGAPEKAQLYLKLSERSERAARAL